MTEDFHSTDVGVMLRAQQD